MDPNTIEIEQMSCDSVDTKPVDFDWTEMVYTDTEEERRWNWAEVVECPGCKRNVVAVNGFIVEHATKDLPDDADDEDALEAEVCPGSGEHHQSAEGPMMSYYYPVKFPTSMEDAAYDIAAITGCVCAVTLADGTEALALTGGGMDLSWEICEAYIALGVLPPVHFAGRLPKMGGMKLTPKVDRVLRAAQRSAQVAYQWACNACDRVRDLRAELVAETPPVKPAPRKRVTLLSPLTSRRRRK